MSNPDLPDLDADEHEVRTGRRFGYTIVGDWVLLNPDLSDRAVRIYCLLRMHCQGTEERAKPAQSTLAEMLGVKKTDTIGKAIKELVGIGAVSVEVTKHRAGRRNTYVVNEAPPPVYDQGPVDRSDFYAKRKQRRDAAEQTVGDGVPPASGVTPISGVMGDPLLGGDGSPPRRGSEAVQEEVLQGGRREDSSDDGAVAPPPPAAGALPQDDELAVARIERHLTWIETEMSGFEPGEESIAASMLEREEPTQKILNTLKKRRRAPIEQKARIGERLGGYQDGEEDVVDYLMYCKYSEDVIVASMLRDRQNGVGWAS